MKPVLFHLPFGLPLYGYGSMLLLSFVVGWLLALHLAERDGLDRGVLARSFQWIVGAALVGARLLYVVTNPGQFDDLLDVFRFWEGGLVAYGGFLGGFAGSAAFCRAKGVPLLAWADCAAPSLCVGLLFTRIGCLLAGCDFGRPWDGPWAIRFPAGSPAFQQQQLAGLLPAGATQSLPVHPTQVYESLVGLALFALVMLVRSRRGFAGQAFLAFVTGYGVLRYLVEVFRADANRGGLGAFSTSQIIGMATFLLGAGLFLRLRRRRHASTHVQSVLPG